MQKSSFSRKTYQLNEVKRIAVIGVSVIVSSIVNGVCWYIGFRWASLALALNSLLVLKFVVPVMVGNLILFGWTHRYKDLLVGQGIGAGLVLLVFLIVVAFILLLVYIFQNFNFDGLIAL